MDFERIRSFVTGKSKQEREEEKKVYKKIRSDSNQAYLKAKKEQALRFARQKAKLETDYKIKRLKSSYSNPYGSSSIFPQSSSILGTSMFGQAPVRAKVPRVKYKTVYKKVMVRSRPRRMIRPAPAYSSSIWG